MVYCPWAIGPSYDWVAKQERRLTDLEDLRVDDYVRFRVLVG
jgi:hypothetical protein